MIERRLTALFSAAALFAALPLPLGCAWAEEGVSRPPAANQALNPLGGRNLAGASRSSGQTVAEFPICRSPRAGMPLQYTAGTGHEHNAATSDNPETHGVYGSGHDQLHYWYQTLKQPGTGMSCCNNQDCRPTSYRMNGNDVQVEVDGEWTTVPQSKILNVQPPDLNAHVCAPKQSSLYPKGYVFCVVLGSGV